MKPSQAFYLRLGADRGAIALAAMLLSCSGLTQAASTPIAQTPVASTRSADVKPNIMLLMDTSDSMAFSHMPDEVEDLVTPTSIGYKNYQCNPLYFNPNTTYLRPREYNGNEFLVGETSFSAAPYEIFKSKITGIADNRNLNTDFQAYYIKQGPLDPLPQTTKSPLWLEDPKQAAYYYLYTGPLAATLDFTSPVCRNAPNGQPTQDALDQGGNVVGTWTLYTVPAAQQQAFANWYSYYRTRMLMMKTAISRSFNSLNDSRRVGFITVEPTRDSSVTNKVNPDKFLAVDDFTLPAGGQRQKFYNKLFAQGARGLSPAREGLARVGRYYGGVGETGINYGMPSTGVTDPVQYSCQQNYTIMTTDGYWNAATETKDTDIAPYRGGPVDLTGKSLVGSISPVLNPDGILGATDPNGLGINVVPYGVWDGTVSEKVRTISRTRTYADNDCNVPANTYSETQSQGETWHIVNQHTTTARTRDQWLSDSFHYKYDVDHYRKDYYYWHKFTDQKSWQQLDFGLDTVQPQRREVPFTTQTTKHYWTSTQQLQETTYQEQQTVTPWDKVVTEGYRTSVAQQYAETSQQTQKTANYTVYTRVRQKQYYYILQFDEGETLGVKTDSCIPSGSTTCDLHHVESSDVWFNVDPTGCLANAPPSSSNSYRGTECQWVDIVAPNTPATSCMPKNATTVASNHYETTCTYVESAASPVVGGCGASVGNPLVVQPNPSLPYTITTCEYVPLAAPHHVPLPCNAGWNGTTTFTVCTDGPLAKPETNSAPCVSQPEADDSYRTCIHDGPTTTYVLPGTCMGNLGGPPNYDPVVTCTPGLAVGPTFVYGACSPTTFGSPPQELTCSGQINVTGPSYVDTCSTPFGVLTTDSTPDYTRHLCSLGPLTVFNAESAACVDNQVTPLTPLSSHAYRTCHVDDLGEINYPPSTCSQHTADASNGFDITCSTPPPTAWVDDPCTDGGVHGSGSGQYTVECGGRSLGTTPVTVCNNGEVNVDPVTGVITTCVLTLGNKIYGWQGSSCTTTGDFTATPPAHGYRCIDDPQNFYVTPACTPAEYSVIGDSGNNYLDSTCIKEPAGSDTSATPCGPGESYDSSKLFTFCTHTTVGSIDPKPLGCAAGGPYQVATTPPVTGEFDYATCTKVTDTTDNPDVFGCSTTEQEDGSHHFTQCHNAFGFTDYPQSGLACSAYVAAHPEITVTCVTTPGAAIPSTSHCGTTGPQIGGSSSGGVDAYFTDECTETQVSVLGPIDPNLCNAIDLGTGNTGLNCNPAVTIVAPHIDTTCTVATSIDTGPPWKTTICAPGGNQQGHVRSYEDKEIADEHLRSGGINTSLVSHTVTSLGTFPYDGNQCHLAGNPLPTLPTAPIDAPLIAGCTAYPCDVSTTPQPGGGSINSVADVAQWYWANDIRPGVAFPNTGDNSVPASGPGPYGLDDQATWQHMTTFVIALGASGTLNYRDDYRTPSGDFASILANGNKRWPIWPDPAINYTVPGAYDDARSIDDFWHTAVNGRGQFFSARDPVAVANGVANALIGIQGATAAGAAAGVTSPEPTVGNNTAYITSYRTYDWYGDVDARAIDVSTGAFTAPTGVTNWSAAALLAPRIGAECDNRTIKLIRSTSSTATLVDFTYGSNFCNSSMGIGAARVDGLNAAELANFDSANAIQNLSQWPQMTDGTSGTENQKANAAGAALVNFIRGQHLHENFAAGDKDKFFRARHGVIGDIVNAQPVYVKTPFADYVENDYAQYKIDKSTSRPGVVYVAANDGMLHAFNASTVTTDIDAGQELWAVIPSTVLPTLHKLADDNYANQHQFYVDQTPTVGDVYTGSGGANGWRTLLVGGLNAGGRGYYALNVTDPLNPVALWEFKAGPCYVNGTASTYGADCNLGLTFGKPLITKLANGTWVVMFTSGYNNNIVPPNVPGPPPSGDGVGYLYVLNAMTGQIISRISTFRGDTTTPSNLGQINAYVDDALTNNTSLRVYGGDMLGYIWRFDVNDNQPPTGIEALQLSRALDSASNGQPITTRPELAEIDGKPMVFVATGRLLAAADVADHQMQSIYGIVDPLTLSSADPVIAATLRSTLKKLTMTQTLVGLNKVRTVACTVNCTSTTGWYVDLPDVGERVNVDMQLVLGTLVVASNVPDTNACSVGGYSWFNYFDFKSGEAVVGTPNNQVSEFLSSALVTGFNVIKVASGIEASVRLSNASSKLVGLQPPPLTPQAKRLSWREIAQ